MLANRPREISSPNAPGFWQRVRGLRARNAVPLAARALRGRRERIGIYALDLTDGGLDRALSGKIPAEVEPSLTLEALEEADAERIAEYAAVTRTYAGLTPERVRLFLAGGCSIILARCGGDLAASVSLTGGPYPLWGFEADLLFPGDHGYCFNIFVAPAWRGRGLGYIMTRQAVRRAGEAGWHWLVVAIHDRNTPSIRMSTNIGYRKCGTLWMREHFFVRRYGFERVAPPAGFSFGLRGYRGGEIWF